MGGDSSLKGLFQGLVTKDCELLVATVISITPIRLQIANDEKLIVGPASVIVPKHLTDYEINMTIKLADGTIDSITEGDGTHSHSGGSHGGHISGSGSHTHSGDGTHLHHLVTFVLDGGTILLRDGLKVGDRVHVLALNGGKLYYILDRT